MSRSCVWENPGDLWTPADAHPVNVNIFRIYELGEINSSLGGVEKRLSGRGRSVCAPRFASVREERKSVSYYPSGWEESG